MKYIVTISIDGQDESQLFPFEADSSELTTLQRLAAVSKAMQTTYAPVFSIVEVMAWCASPPPTS